MVRAVREVAGRCLCPAATPHPCPTTLPPPRARYITSFAHSLRLAGLNPDDPDDKPRFGVIEGGKQNGKKADAT